MQAIGNHFYPFFVAIENTMSGDGNQPLQILIMTVLRALVIAGFLVAAYAIGHLLSSVLGKEIVIEEEVIVEEEDDDEIDRETNSEPAAKEKRRNARDKKTQ